MNPDNCGHVNNIELNDLEEGNNKNTYNISIYHDETHTDLVINSNFLNLFSSIYVSKEKGILLSLPHMAVFITCYFFWRNPRYNYTRYIDYIVAQTSIGFTLIYSFILNKQFAGIFLFSVSRVDTNSNSIISLVSIVFLSITNSSCGNSFEFGVPKGLLPLVKFTLSRLLAKTCNLFKVAPNKSL